MPVSYVSSSSSDPPGRTFNLLILIRSYFGNSEVAARKPSPKLVGIEGARGIAALLVVLYHTGRTLSLGQYYGHVPLRGFFNFGHAGVDFFFVLSGFIIYFVHHSQIGQRSALPNYARRRAKRIFPIYWVVSLLILAIMLAIRSNEAPPSLGRVLVSVFLLPLDYEPLLGVAWTLQHEMLFYALFGLAILDRRLGFLVFGAWIALILATGGAGGPLGVATSLRNLQFALGIIGAHLVLRGGIWRPVVLLVVGTIAFLASGLCENTGLIVQWGTASQVLFGLSATLIVVGLAAAEQQNLLRGGRAMAMLGAISYVLYLIHYTVVGPGAKLLAAAGALRAVPEWVSLCVLSGSAVVVTIALHYGIERPLLWALRARRQTGALPCSIPAT